MNNKSGKFKIFITCMITLVFALTSVSCTEQPTEVPELEISDSGVDFALALAENFPFRNPYSLQEKQAGEFIKSELVKLGYSPIVSNFNNSEDGDNILTSSNIYIKIPGTGFVISENNADNSNIEERIFKQIIIGAHYDTQFGVEQSEDYPDYDGINDNASGVGALISVAAELKEKQMGYDVILVFFGASNDNFAGARYFAENMTVQDIADTDVMYNIESIYAGDKLYANAGNNSLEAGMKYIRRRKLYEISDAAINHRIDLRFNQSDLDIDVNGDGEDDVYREITKTVSDHTVFDNLGIPCVFIESYEYFAPSVEEQMESRNPYFAETNGMVRGTVNDSLITLSEIFEEDRLVTRIKNTAFLLIKAIEKGIYLEQYID